MIKKLIIKLISLIVPLKILIKLEVIIGGALGKGVEFGVINNFRKVLYYDKNGSGGASLYERRQEHFNNKFEEVQSISLDALLKNEFNNNLFEIDFCKIDTEGHEFTILNSFKDNFKKLKLIQFEFGGTNIDSRTYFQDFWYLLKDYFDIYRIAFNGPILIKEYNERDEIIIF